MTLLWDIRRHLWPTLIGSIVWAVFIGSACPACRAQTQPSAGYQARLLSVTVTGSGAYPTNSIVRLSGLEIGSVVNHDTIQAAANHLAQSGLFSDVRFSYASQINGVTVAFRVKDAPSFPISFDNFPWFTDQELHHAFENAGLPLRDSAPASGSVLGSAVQVLERELATVGVHASVEYNVTVEPVTGQRLLRFRVVGADLKIGSVEFSDALATNAPDVRTHLHALLGKPFSRTAVEEFERRYVAPLYLERGYLRVSFGNPEARFTGNPLGPLPKDVLVLVPIHPGAVYTWGGVSWSGNHVFSAGDLDTMVNAEGIVAGHAADGTKISAIWKNLLEAYEQRGYMDAQVTPTENFDPTTHRAAYKVAISEGIQYHMGKLILTGLSPWSEQKVRKAWRLEPGQVFDKTYFNDFLSAGIARALKGTPSAQDKIGHYLQRNPQQATVDVMIDFQ